MRQLIIIVLVDLLVSSSFECICRTFIDVWVAVTGDWLLRDPW